MFTEWGETERGAGWIVISQFSDGFGNTIAIDPTLNLIVVCAFPDTERVVNRGRVEVDKAVFFEGSPRETVIERVRDTLVWVVAGGQRELCVGPGVGGELLRELRQRAKRGEPSLHVLDLLSQVPDGPTRSELEAIMN